MLDLCIRNDASRSTYRMFQSCRDSRTSHSLMRTSPRRVYVSSGAALVYFSRETGMHALGSPKTSSLPMTE